jgi:hypothetical protein
MAERYNSTFRKQKKPTPFGAGNGIKGYEKKFTHAGNRIV